MNLASELLSSNSQDIRERFNDKLRSLTEGEIPHAANAISELFGILNSGRVPDVPTEAKNTNPGAKSKCTWAEGGNHGIPPRRGSMNIALIKSMHHGSFLDMEYYVRKQRTGTDPFAPIYLSGTIFRGVRSKLDSRRSVCPTHSALIDFLQWHRHSTLSLERKNRKLMTTAIMKKSRPPGSRKLEATIRRERVVFRATISFQVPWPRESELSHTTRSCFNYSSWKSLFLYLCFDEITVRLLTSQKAFLGEALARLSLSGALSCSPKSVYHLAELVGYTCRHRA